MCYTFQPDSAKRWSIPVPLNPEYIDTFTQEKGIYQIGTYRRPADGINKRFNPKYTGKSESNIRRRVRAHYEGNGNRSVDEYLDEGEVNHLYVRTKIVQSPKRAEAQELQKESKNEWNERVEHGRKRKPRNRK